MFTISFFTAAGTSLQLQNAVVLLLQQVLPTDIGFMTNLFGLAWLNSNFCHIFYK